MSARVCVCGRDQSNRLVCAHFRADDVQTRKSTFGQSLEGQDRYRDRFFFVSAKIGPMNGLNYGDSCSQILKLIQLNRVEGVAGVALVSKRRAEARRESLGPPNRTQTPF